MSFEETQSHSTAGVLIVDDHPVMRMGLKQLIDTAGDLRVVGEAGTCAEGLAVFDSVKDVDLVIIDVSLPDRSGLELLKELRAIRSDLKCLAISSHDEEVYAERVLRAGGRGYVMKGRAPDQLVEAIRNVLAGGVFLSPKMTARMMETFAGGGTGGASISALTDRELEVFRAIGEGKSSREVAGELGISIRTIDAHRTHIKEKLALKDAAELSYEAIRWVESQG